MPAEPDQDETRCIIARAGRLWLVDLESGRLARPLNAYSDARSSFAWVGDHVYPYDMETGSIAKISAIDGAVETKPLIGPGPGIFTLAAWGQRLVLYGLGGISIFASFDDIPNAPIARYRSAMTAQRVAVVDDLLLGAWHSTDEIEVFDLARGLDLPPIALVDYDGWIYGLGVTISGQIAMLIPDEVLQIRDRETGALVQNVPFRLSAGTELAMACGGAPPPIEVAQPAPADPVTVQAACGPSGYSTFDSGASGSPSLHVVSVGEPSEGVVDVHVGRPGDAVLALVASQATHWKVTQGPSTNLTRVIVQGDELQTLTGPLGVMTDITYRADGGAPTLSYSDDWRSYTARRLRFNVEQLTNLPMRSFTGCGEGSSFTIE